MRRRTLLLVALLVAVPLLAGCAEPARHARADPSIVRAVANTRADRWRVGDHWEYHATIHQNQSFDVALVVHETLPGGGFRLGSNLSAGFFGLPFTGNVTRDFSPVLGDETWPMYRFPLSDGASWSYHLFGHDATTTARASLVDVPGRGRLPGFELESKSLGQVFARYDYSPEAGWFTHLELIDPAKRETILAVQLRSFGDAYAGGYFVERVIAEERIESPSPPFATRVIDVPAGRGVLHVQIQAQATLGALDATLRDEEGDAFLHVRAVGPGVDASDTSVSGGPHAWRVELVGAAKGFVLVQVTGIERVAADPTGLGVR